MKNPRLQVMYCIPGKAYVGDKAIIAKVSDGEKVQMHKYGPHQSLRHIHEMVPRLWGFNESSKRRKAAI
jgi:hypothetical protein